MSVGVDGDVSAYSSDWASDSRDSRESASQHAMKPTWKSRRASGAWSCATGAHARSAGDGLSRRSSTENRRIHSAQSSCVSRTRDSHIRRSDACFTASFFGRATGTGGGRRWRAVSTWMYRSSRGASSARARCAAAK